MRCTKTTNQLRAAIFVIVGIFFVWNGVLFKFANENEQNVISESPLAMRIPEIYVNRLDINATLDILEKSIKAAKNKTSPKAWNAKKFILVVTSWRSGSTFFGEVVANHPTVFLHYEPLWHLSVWQIRGGIEADETVHHLKSLLQCRFNNHRYNRVIDEHMEGLMKNNVHTWNACIRGPNRRVCSMPSFLEQACSKFPTVVAKIVRLRLNLTRSLLEDPDLHRMKVVYLVRDPRATLLSRKSFDWCRSSRDCIDPKLLCDDIDSDLDAMRELSSVYPDKVMLVKYETLAADPLKTFESIFKFSGLSFLPSINETIRRHTSANADGAATTFRKSAERIDRWRTHLNQSEIDEIERNCINVINRLAHL